MANIGGPSTTSLSTFGYSGSTLHQGGFQSKSQSNFVLGFRPKLSILGWTTSQSYKMATLIFLGMSPGHEGYITPILPGVPYHTGPALPPINQDALVNMIERMYGLLL